MKHKINTELTNRNWSVQRLSDETGVNYHLLTDFINGNKDIGGESLNIIINCLGNTQIHYKLKQLLLEDDSDIQLTILDGFGSTIQYTPVMLAMYMLNKNIIYYTENKSGSLKHAYSIAERKLIDIALIKDLESLSSIIDKQRY